MTITEQVQQIIDRARRWSPRMARRMCSVKLLQERGGLPQAPGERVRESKWRVTELRWQLERFAEMIEWELDMAEDVFAGRRPLHKCVMIMLQERGYYDGEFGDLRYETDVWVQQRIDPTEDVRR